MQKRIPIFLGIVLVCFSVWLFMTSNKLIDNLIKRLDILSYDLQLRASLKRDHVDLAPIVIVDIDGKSLKTEGRWPWPRSKLGNLIEILHNAGATVIAFDMIFPDKERNIAEVVSQELQKRNLLNPQTYELLNNNKTLFDEDELFATSIIEVQSILAWGFFQTYQTTNLLPQPLMTLTTRDSNQLNLHKAKGYISNTPVLQDAAKYSGFINVYPDIDGIVRHLPIIIEYNYGIYPSLSLKTVMVFLNKDISLITPQYDHTKKLKGIQLGSHFIPTDTTGKVLIPFVGKSFTFTHYSATDILRNHIQSNWLKGKIVFIGATALGIQNIQSTPIQSNFPDAEIHATVANGILKNNFSSMPEWLRTAQLSLTIILGLIATFVFPYLGPRTLAFTIILTPLVLLLISHLVWYQTGFIISLLLPISFVILIGLINIIFGYVFETRKRERLKEIFGQYVPAKHIEKMLKGKSGFALKGESRELTVLFADIRNFTMISENMPADEIVDMLNTFFTPMTEIIFSHQGTIDKYVGDSIMAFWGAPLKDKYHAQHAIFAALEMQKTIKGLKNTMNRHHWSELEMGIGINSGIMNVGDMGSRYRRNYTVLGDAVNLASRIENLLKFYSVNIIVTENTINHVRKNEFVFRKLDKVKVKGKEKVISLYEVICFASELTSELAEELEIYHKALDYYYRKQWDDALALMIQLKEKHHKTKIYQIYIERIKEFKHKLFPADWDGVYVHRRK